ncbi:MAG TPA: tetratricopeptide repeat protein [Nitrospiria bacterium]|nr:tetratricopeptide repeat protein [Nitrospiria bacterium]
MKRFGLLYLAILFLLTALGENRITLAGAKEDAEKHYNDGIEFDKKRQFPEAIKELTQAVELNPESHKYHQALFLTYTNNRKGLKGIEDYKRLERRWPKSAGVHFWLGRFYLESGNFEEAAKEIKEASLLSPKDEHIWLSLGHAWYRLGKNDEALEAYKKANELTPHLAVVHTGLGNVYFKKKDYSRARKEYEEALKLDSSFEEARYNLSLIYEKQGETDRAIKEWKALLDADPNESKIREKLAGVYFKRKQYLEAVQEYSMLSQINQSNPAVYFRLGEAEVLLAAESDDPEEREHYKKGAIEAFQHTLMFDPKNQKAAAYLKKLKAPLPTAGKK